MLLALFLCIPVAAVLIACLSTAARARASDLSRCIACGYSRTSLAADAACPECGRTPAAAATRSTPLSLWVYALFVPPWALVMVGCGAMENAAIPYAFVTWPLALGALAGCLALVAPILPRRRAWAVAICLLAPIYLGAAATVIWSGLLYTGRIPHGEYGPGLDIVLMADLASPILCGNVSLWLFSIAAIWILIEDRQR